MNTWILTAGSAAIENLIATARGLGGDVTALVLGDTSIADAVAASGVDAVKWAAEPGDAPFEAYAAAVADAVAAAAPAVVLVPTRPAERALAGAVAAKLGAPIFTMVSAIAHDGDAVTLTHTTFGGIAEETVKVTGPVVVLGEPGAVATGGSASIDSLELTPTAGLSVVESRPSTHAAVELGKAKRIVAVGRGVKSADDLTMIDELAAALGAEVACSRPLAEGLEWFTHDRYIGVTGQHVAPELYVALGISGQLQHVVGARGAGTVIVVNSDADAPYFAECDYGLVGDLYSLVPAITAAAK